MATENYRSAKNVPVKVLGMVKAGKHKGSLKLRTQKRVGKRPKGSIDYRKPDKVHGLKPRARVSHAKRAH